MAAFGGAPGRRVTLVVNPGADRGAALRAGAVAAAVLRSVAEVTVHTPRGGPAGSLAALRGAVSDGADAVVVCGGDGIVHLAANVLAGGDVPLGIVPAGSGNDIADVLGMDRDPAAAARQLAGAWAGAAGPAGDGAGVGDRPGVRARVGVDAGARVERIDLGRCDGPRLLPGVDRAFVGLLYAGFDAAVNERANRMRRMPGSFRYNAALAAETARLRARRFRLEIDGVRREVPAILVAVGNGPQYGGGKRMAPHARWDDGVLGMTVIGPVSRYTLARLAPTLPRAGHVGHPRVLMLDAAAVSVACDDPGVVAYADGEPVGPLPLRAWVQRAALPVLVPGGHADRPGGHADRPGAPTDRW